MIEKTCKSLGARFLNRHYFQDYDYGSIVCSLCCEVLKVGTKVRVKKPITDPEHNGPGWLPDMDKYDGQIWTIARPDGDGYLEFEEDPIDDAWSFSFDWCEIVPDNICLCPSLLNGHHNGCFFAKKKT